MNKEKVALREKLTNIAINSKCTICGKDISFQLWECSEKSGKYYFVHRNCLFKGKENK
jgi:hypothetical protein